MTIAQLSILRTHPRFSQDKLQTTMCFRRQDSDRNIVKPLSGLFWRCVFFFLFPFAAFRPDHIVRRDVEYDRHSGGAADIQRIPIPLRCEKRLFEPLYIEMMILPRQARDKHRESTQKKPVFLGRKDHRAKKPRLF